MSDEKTTAVRPDLTDYELAAVRLLVHADVTRSEKAGTEERRWPSAVRSVARKLDLYCTVDQAIATIVYDALHNPEKG